MPMDLLVVDDDDVTRQLLKEFLETRGFRVTCAASAESALEIAQIKCPPLVLTDIRMEAQDGLSLLKQLKAMNPHVGVVLMTGFGSMDGAIEAIQKGAFDYISKPFDLEKLAGLLKKASAQGLGADSDKKKPVARSKPVPIDPKTLLGKSAAMVEVYKLIAKATLSNSNVLILGESGTGKELVARAIHHNSSRKTKKFVAVNCGALTETLLESELFGYKKGAFTGAHFDKKGLFEEADGGSILLDEIGDITPAFQVKLLRVLQDGEIKPVGTGETQQIDVRVIAATHRNLDDLVREGKFREDLLYRLRVIELQIPPLRDRREDIPELAEVFLAKYSERFDKRVDEISGDALHALSHYRWPGNVRELEHQVERAVAMTSGHRLERDDFSIFQERKTETGLSESQGSLEILERDHILAVLKKVDYNKTKAAEILGIDRATLYRKAQRYRLL